MAIVAPKVHKTLSADALFALIHKAFSSLGDHRSGTPDISLADALMSAFAMFSLKAPSLLALTKSEPKAICTISTASSTHPAIPRCAKSSIP